LASRCWFDPDRPVNEEELLSRLEAQLAAKFSAAAKQLCRPAAPAVRASRSASLASSEDGGVTTKMRRKKKTEEEEEDEEMDDEEEEVGISEEEVTEESDTVADPQSP
ncbi:hypothetical protein BOX15_Mlig015732g1, partial [Macrostomum lignano]